MKPKLGVLLLLLASLLLASGVPFAADSKAEKAAAQARANQGVAKAAAKLVDINSAKKEQLSRLPTLNDEIAGKIVAGRPYKSKGQLLSRNILTFLQYEEIRARIIAKQPGTVETKPPKQAGAVKSAPRKQGTEAATGTRL